MITQTEWIVIGLSFIPAYLIWALQHWTTLQLNGYYMSRPNTWYWFFYALYEDFMFAFSPKFKLKWIRNTWYYQNFLKDYVDGKISDKNYDPAAYIIQQYEFLPEIGYFLGLHLGLFMFIPFITFAICFTFFN